ncbi:MAG: sugar phosphate nucleotidyltransferase [bacterium]|nr:sugar phosphate nucleotidyltransferase [bacterium]
MEKDTIAVILAAGEGTRMKSSAPKVLHKLCGTPIINYSLNTTSKLSFIKETLVILGHKAEEVKKTLPSNVKTILQREQLGTGHALMQIKNALGDFKGNILVLCADAPLLTVETLEKLYQTHKKQNASATILTSVINNPKGYGRVTRNNEGMVVKIVEELDATPSEKNINEINTSIYCFKWEDLHQALNNLKLNQEKGEYYLTDCIENFIKDQLVVASLKTEDPNEALGINNRIHLSKAENRIREQILNNLMLQGVTILDPNSTFVDQEVKIEQDTIIYPYTSIMGNTVIESKCVIGPFSCIINSEIENECTVFSSFIVNSHIERNSSIGPYDYFKNSQQVKLGE